MTTNENYNQRLIEYGKGLLDLNDKTLLKFLDKKFQIARFQREEIDTELEFSIDLKTLEFSDISFTMTFNDPILALRDVFSDIHHQLNYLKYEHPRYIYISLEINKREWIWFEAHYPAWDLENNTLTFNYRIEQNWDKSGYIIMGNLFQYHDFPFIPNLLEDLLDDYSLEPNLMEFHSVNRLFFKDSITLDLTKEKFNPYKVLLGFHY